MGEGRGVVAAGLGAVIAVLLQVVVAPNIALASALPNFVLAYALVLAAVRPDRTGPVLAFVLGLVFDLLGSGPVGAMAFLLVLVTFLASRAFSVLDNDTLFMPLVILVVSTLVVELFYAVFLMGTGFSAGPLDVFLYRALPCALYDCVVALVMFPLALRFLASRDPQQPGKPRLR